MERGERGGARGEWGKGEWESGGVGVWGRGFLHTPIDAGGHRPHRVMLQFRSIYANAANPIAYDSPSFHLPPPKSAKFRPRRAEMGRSDLADGTRGAVAHRPRTDLFCPKRKGEWARGGAPRFSPRTGMGATAGAVAPQHVDAVRDGGRAGNEVAKSFQTAPESGEGGVLNVPAGRVGIARDVGGKQVGSSGRLALFRVRF